MSIEAARELLATATDLEASEDDVGSAVGTFFRTLADGSRDEANAALGEVAGSLPTIDRSRAGFLGLLCGAMVERGCDAERMARPYADRLKRVLESSLALARASEERIAEMASPGDTEGDSGGDFRAARAEVAQRMPQENADWELLEQFWRPGVAAFSVSAAARAQASDLQGLAAKFAHHHEGAHWLSLILGVLDNEPIVVLEPTTSLGVVGTISGVVDNFQLNVLIMDAFPRRLLSGRRVSQPVADAAQGIGPQQLEDTVTGTWNLYTWKAILPDKTLPDPNARDGHAHWVWNEGTPSDIPVFEGHRVVLLGPPSYSRSWRAQRMFDKLAASLEIERKLTKAEVDDWLTRLAAASTR